jgi:hypothetical protein
MNDIICHIGGMDNKIKNDFIKYISENYEDVIVKDLDEFGDEIKQTKKTYTQEYWKKTFENKVNDFIKNNKKNKIIYIGSNICPKNCRAKVNLECDNNFFLKTSSSIYAKDMICYNLDKYKTDIINGKYSLNNIDRDYLMNQYEKLEDVYKNINYKKKTYDAIKDWLKMYLNENKIIKNEIYVGGNFKQNEYIKQSKSNISSRKLKLREFIGGGSSDTVGYKYDWIACLSSIQNVNRLVDKGFIRDGELMVPFVEEKYDGAFNNLYRECHIHTVNKEYFNKLSWYKYESTADHDIPILSYRYVQNIYNFLEENGVRMIKYKNKN